MTSIDIKVLSVEDDPVAYRVLAVILERPHFITEEDKILFDLHWVQSLEEARRALLSENFDIVLLDLYMPGSAGLENLETLVKEFPDTPIIVISALEHATLGPETMAHGAQDYLPKATLHQVGLVRSITHSLARMRWIKQGHASAEFDGKLFDDLTNLREMRKIQAASSVIRE